MDGSNPSKPGLSSAGALNIKSEHELSDTRRRSTSEDVASKHGTAEKESSYFPPSGVSGASEGDTAGSSLAGGRMDHAKIASMQHIVDTAVSAESKQRINQLVAQVETLSSVEKLMLYLRLPTGATLHDPLKQPLNPLGSRSEIQQTVNWIQTHLEVDPDVSLPKQDVYDEYIAFAMSSNMKPLSTADFGKVMKQVYPSVRPRRLGTRGNSRYCYAGLSKKIKLEVPQLPEISDKPKTVDNVDLDATSQLIRDWAGKVLGVKFDSLQDLAKHLWANNMVETQTLSPAISSYVEDIEVLPAAESDQQRQRGVIKQLKRKIQASPGRPKKGKAEEVLPQASPPPNALPAVAADPYAYPGSYLPLQTYDTRPPPYLLYEAPPARAAHAHTDYSDPYKFDPYRREPAVPETTPRFAHGTSNVPINLSSDAARPASYYRDQSTASTSLDLTTPVRQETPPIQPTKLPLPGKKMILEAYQHETQSGSPHGNAASERTSRNETEVVGYLPKKMRAAEIAGGKLRAHSQQASTSKDDPPPVKNERNEPGTFFEDPKNVTCRSRDETAALVPSDAQQCGAAVRPARGRPRKTSPTKAKYVRRKQKNAERTPQQQDSCCGLDGINFKTGIICEERHSEILNRERVISICGLDKHALDDYLNEGSSQEHEEELMKYFHDSKEKSTNAETKSETNFLGQPPEDPSQGNKKKIDQLRELLEKNLKNHSRSASPQKPAEPTPQNNVEQVGEQQANTFKSIAGPNIVESSAQSTTKNSDPYQFFPCLEQANNVKVTQSNPQSPATRTQQYDFVPISPSNISPKTSNMQMNFPYKEVNRVKYNGSHSHSTEASPFVSPRNTPVPRSKAAQKPMPNKSCRKKSGPNCCLNILGQKSFAVPNEQNFTPKSPGYNNVRLRPPPMSAPPSPNIHSTFYHPQFHSFPQSNGTTNGHSGQILLQPEQRNGECSQLNQSDSLSCEVSQLFQNGNQRNQDISDPFRSQSAPLNKNFFPDDGTNFDSYRAHLTYSLTSPSSSVPPTPVPQEFCDFGAFSETCESISQGLNSESLSKIYKVIDSSEDMLNTDTLDHQPLNTLLVKGGDFAQNISHVLNDDDDMGKRTFSLDYELGDIVDKSKSCYSRSVPSTPLPSKRSHFQLSNNICKNLTPELNACNNVNSKSVPSTPLMMGDRTAFNYNRDYLISGNTLEVNSLNNFESDDPNETFLNGNVNGDKGENALIESLQESPLEEILQDTLHSELDNFTTQSMANDNDILADLDKIGAQTYGVM